MPFDQLRERLSVDKAWAHLHWLTEHAPARVSGSGDDRRAAEYFAEQLSGYGLETRLDRFTSYRSIPGRAAFEVLSPAPSSMACAACGHIASTPDAGIEAELAYLGPGDEAAYDGIEAAGRVVLTNIAPGPPRPEKARLAADHGAAGIVFINLGPAEYTHLPMGAIKGVWGNPTRATLPEIPQIPAVGVTRADGETLKALCARGAVRVRMTAQATRDWGPLPQTWARLRASRSTGDVLVVGGHFDAWEPGVSDNGAGNALILELARVFGEYRDPLRRDVIFALWNGHEIGEIAGSTWFLDTHWDELDEHGVAYFNVDSVGYAGTDHFETASTPELIRFHQEVETTLFGAPCRRRRLTRANEQPFFPLGMPGLEGAFHYSPEQIAAWDGAAHGWWWHSRADTLDKVDRMRFRETFDVYAGYIREMCTRPVLPMDFRAVAGDLHLRVDRVAAAAQDVLTLDLPIYEFQEAARKLHHHIDRYAGDERRVERINPTLKRLSRILMPAFETEGGRYAQDRVGLPAHKSPIPLLHAMEAYVAAPPESERRCLLETELVRARNALSDALRRATWEIERLTE